METQMEISLCKEIQFCLLEIHQKNLLIGIISMEFQINAVHGNPQRDMVANFWGFAEIFLHCLQCFQKKYTSQFWRICFNLSKMKRFYMLSTEFFFFSLSAETGNSSWSSYNIFFKILMYYFFWKHRSQKFFFVFFFVSFLFWTKKAVLILSIGSP